MTRIIYQINHKLSKQLIAKVFDPASWYIGQLKKSVKELRGFWYEQDYK